MRKKKPLKNKSQAFMNQKFLSDLRRQIIMIFVGACCAGLGMNALFMANINSTITQLREDHKILTAKQEKLEEKLYQLTRK